MKDFVYFSEEALDIPLNEDIVIANESVSESDFIVSNSSKYPAEIIAHEIDFYIKNTKDTLSSQINNINKIYEMNTIRFDMSQNFDHYLDVSNQVLLICNDEQKKTVDSLIASDEFDIFHIEHDRLEDISGSIGDFHIIVKDRFKNKEINTSQIIWFDAKDADTKLNGCFDPLSSSVEDVLKTIRENISNFSYKHNTVYDASICQYHERREEICARCVDECPTVAIVKHDESKHLEFSQVDCVNCGGCISVCPSGALEYTPLDRKSISSIAKLLNSHIPLIIPKTMKINDLSIDLKSNVLPFVVDSESFLHESTLLTLLQESGSQLVFFSDFISKGTTNAIDILNQVYQLKHNKDAIIVASNQEELAKALNEVDFVEQSQYSFSNHDVRKREEFALRLKNIVGEDDLGEVKCGEYIHYGVVKVNESNCTLCLACVGACNLGAIVADSETNSLQINPSICTTCGYCEATCPEKDCLSIERDVIKLNPSWFVNNIIAQDELFPCVECGKEFATKKAIDKIASIMSPLFKLDPEKERTLYCCEDCKPKIMMKSYLKNKITYE